MPNWLAISFQDSNSPMMEQILFFHDHAMIVLSLITILTLYLVLSLTMSKTFNKYTTEGQEIETIWTILPALALIFIALPSLKTLYLTENTKSPDLMLKAIGHQWYWSYEYGLASNLETENFMEMSQTTRLLKTSESLYIPVKLLTRIVTTSVDVIHSWTISSMGVKADALPGRLNQMFLLPKRLGVYSGQCSEICGMNHSFMPILMNVMTPNSFMKTLLTK